MRSMPNQSAQGITALPSIQNYPLWLVNLSSQPWQVYARDLNFHYTLREAEPARKASRLITDANFLRGQASE